MTTGNETRTSASACTPGCPADAHGDPTMLLECRREQDVLDGLLDRLARGSASVLTFAGRPGHAQNALVRRAACRAAADGIRVLRAQATPAERELRHGVVLQLLTSAAGSILDPSARPRPSAPLPGLDDLLRSARTSPTLIAVEDVQWLDPASLIWMQALLGRLGPDTPLAILASTSSGDGLAPAVGGSPNGPVPVQKIVVPALTDRGVAATVRTACSATGDEEFIAALTSATAGNPAILHDVLRAFTAEGRTPTAAHLPELHVIIAGVVGDHTVRALDGLPGEVTSVLRALVVCGDLLDFSLVRSLVESRSIPDERIRTLLESVGLTVSVGDKVHIRFPVAKARVIEEMPVEERAGLYTRAAVLAHRSRVNDEDIAQILLRSPPLGTSWTVPLLRRSSVAALRREDHDRACACLTRALREPLDASERIRLTLELAAAEAVIRPEAGDRRLGELVRGAVRAAGPSRTDTGLRGRAVDLGFARGDGEWARRTAAEALANAGPADRDDLTALFWLAAATHDGEPMVPEVPPLPDRPVPPAQAGVRAWQLATAGDDAARARTLARLALTGDGTSDTLMLPRLAGCSALIATEDFDEAGAALDSMLATARRAHLRGIAARILNVRAGLHLRAGRLDDAERDLDSAERSLPATSWHPMTLPVLIAHRICVSVEAGRLDRARHLADRTPLPAGGEEGVWWSALLFARALVAAEDGNWQDTLRLSRESGRRLLHRQWTNPALLSWRSLAAEASMKTGDPAEARRLWEEELALSDRWGTAGARGISRLWSSRFLDEHPDRAVARSREAAALLRESPARLAYLWSLLRQAGAESAQGDTAAAARSLREVTAVRPATRLAVAARGLAAAVATPTAAAPPVVGAVPPASVHPPGWRTLSDAERDTVLLAGRGHGNRQIAEQLSVSRRTVELRLSNAYRKLQISGRKDLHGLLDTMEGAVADAS